MTDVNVIVVGCSRVGSQLATMLSVEGHNVIVIDRDEDAFKRLGNTFNGVTLRGLGFDEDVLETAGIRECDAFAAVTDLDNTNLMAAEVARKIFAVPHVVARLYNPVRERTYQQLGLDYVCGTTLVAEHLLDKIMSGHGHHVLDFGDVEVLEFSLSEKAEGRRLAEIEVRHRFRVVAVLRTGVTIIPDTDTVLHRGDVIVAAVKDEHFAKIQDLMEG